jgi:hypothetical protein
MMVGSALNKGGLILVHCFIFAIVVTCALSHNLARAQTPTSAQQRLQAAAELQRTFDGSMLKGLDLKFFVRGDSCNILHVEGSNLYDTMMTALANGTLVYGKVLPGGVNQFAFGRGFRDTVYTNRLDNVHISYGPSKLDGTKALKLQKCDDSIAAKVTEQPSQAATKPTPPPFEPLSWTSAVPGQKLYDGSYNHEATIISVDKASGQITVKYVRTGSVEPKRLDAVANFWYVKK